MFTFLDSAAAVTILLWDMVLTLPDEVDDKKNLFQGHASGADGLVQVERVWRARKSAGTTLFFLVSGNSMPLLEIAEIIN